MLDNVIPFPLGRSQGSSRMNTTSLRVSPPVSGGSQSLDHRIARRALERLGHAVILTDACIVPLLANSMASAVLLRGDIVTIVGGQLTLVSRQARASFLSFVTRPPEVESETQPLMLRLERCDGPPCQLIAVRLDDADGPTDGSPHLFMISLFDPHANCRIEPRVLMALHGLTPAEARVAAMLFECQSLTETARRLRVHPGTVKTHLKHVFEKCGVRTQAGLLQLLALGPRSA